MEPFRIDSNREHSVTPSEEREWLRRVREKGCRHSFEKLFRIYYRPLHSFAGSYVRRQDADDIVQSVFFRIWEQRCNIDPDGSVRHYLYKAIRNEALNAIRKERSRRRKEDELSLLEPRRPHTTSPGDRADDEALKRSIEQAIDRLPQRCRTIFLLNRQSGLTYREIAEVLEISENTVTTQMGRALHSLRKQLGGAPLLLLTVLCSGIA